VGGVIAGDVYCLCSGFLVTLILIVSVLYLLDYRKKKAPEKPTAKAPVTAPEKAVPSPKKPHLLPKKEKPAIKELPVTRR
jgi:hypothetical protein